MDARDCCPALNCSRIESSPSGSGRVQPERAVYRGWSKMELVQGSSLPHVAQYLPEPGPGRESLREVRTSRHPQEGDSACRTMDARADEVLRWARRDLSPDDVRDYGARPARVCARSPGPRRSGAAV